VSRFLTERQHS